MNLPKPMQHHSMPPRPQHMRHPMHQGPMHPGHPPPHMAINMGPPPPQQQPHHMPNAPAPRGPPPQQFGMPQMRDQNRLGHHQHPQQHPQQRLNNQMQQQNQLQHHKGRPPHIGGCGIPQGPLQQANMQKNVPSIRNNALPNHQSQQAQQPRIPPPQQIPLNGGCGGPQMQILKGPSQPPLQQQQQIQLAQHHKVNAMQQVPPNHLNPQQISHMQAQAVPIPQQPPPPPQQQQQQQQQQLQQQQQRHTQHHQQYHQKQQQNVHHRTPQRQHQHQQQQHQQQQQQQPNRQQQKFSHPRAILQNPNRVNNQLNGNVSIPTPLPTVTEVESAVISSTPAQNASAGTVVSEQLSATAEDFTPQSSQVTVSEEKSDNESSGLINDILSVVMKGDGCFSNSKEKTPMCLVNELARYNKIQHQYRLTSENGPAHCKRFTVTLKLGDEEYSAEGYKIKKAQHTAAAEAIKKTKYKHPLPKAIRRPEESLRTTITPTVELNALAMKLGQQTYYVFDPRSQPDSTVNGTDTQFSQSPNQFNNSRLSRNTTYPPSTLQQQQRFPAGRGFAPKYPGPGRIPSVNGVAGVTPQMANGTPPEMCKITLIVGKQKFVGTGRTLQSAKHDAASRALQVLKTQAANKFKEILTRTAEEGDWKSPISLVHEIAIKRNLTVTFKVLREEGPAHMKNFITTCEVGNIITEGDGNGKKISKKRAAEKMLEELKKLPPPSPSKSPPVKRIKVKNFKRKTSPTPKKKGSSSIREKTESECAEDANPISRLIQIQQSRNEKEPSYELISRGGESKKREFVMEVNVPGNVARGTGASKKLAKRSAAHNLLIAMGIEVEETGNEENNSQIANQNPDTKVTRKVKFSETNSTCEASEAIVTPQSANGGPSGRQIVPGVLLLRQHSKDSDETENLDTPATASAAEVPKSVSPPAKNKSAISNTETSNSVRPKDQLMYLAQILGFQANFSDYPKGNHSEFLTIVTLSTAPPQICHGVGLNTEESQDQAASAALQILSKLGLDNIKPKPDG